MQLNAEDEDNGNRKFICVQLPEPTDEKSEAYKAGYKTIFDITKARIEKSAVKIRQDFKETTADLGF
ncbi:type iii restriction-modification system methyltransferase [Haemophilus influenzae]|nr:type iii restriction-modification system methyltransferase [Haemophilus influenzae]